MELLGVMVHQGGLGRKEKPVRKEELHELTNLVFPPQSHIIVRVSFWEITPQ